MNQKILLLSLLIFVQTKFVLSQARETKESGMNLDRQSQWVKFTGKKTNNGNKVILTAPSGESFSIQKNAFKRVADSMYIRNNTIINPAKGSLPSLTGSDGCGCPVKILATNREERIPKHGCDTKCYGVILACTTCVYNAAGVFIKEETKICGGCIGLPF